MTRDISSDAIKESYIVAMGRELGLAFWHLREEVLLQFVHWHEFEMLYVDKRRVDALNEIAGGFFGHVQRLMERELILGLRRLSDPAMAEDKFGNNPPRANLSIGHLNQLVSLDQKATDEFKKHIATLVTKAESRASFARTLSNRVVVHNDLETRLLGPSTLPRATHETISKAHEAIWAVMERIETEYTPRDITAHPKHMVYPRNGVDSLMPYLRAGYFFEKARRQHFVEGNVTSDELALDQLF